MGMERGKGEGRVKWVDGRQVFVFVLFCSSLWDYIEGGLMISKCSFSGKKFFFVVRKTDGLRSKWSDRIDGVRFVSLRFIVLNCGIA